MTQSNTHSKGFLLSLTASLILHLGVLLFILVPSNNRTSFSADTGQSHNSADFSPSLLISFDPEVLSGAEQALEQAKPSFIALEQDKIRWHQAKFRKSLQDLLQQQGLKITSVTIPRGQLDDRVYSIRVVLTTSPQQILADCLIVTYVAGFATKSSNFRSDSLVLLFNDEAGALITAKIESYDCRLFASRKITADQLLQRLTLS